MDLKLFKVGDVSWIPYSTWAGLIKLTSGLSYMISSLRSDVLISTLIIFSLMLMM